MNRDDYDQFILNEFDLIDLLMRGRSFVDLSRCIVDDELNASLLNCQLYQPITISQKEFDEKNQAEWRMPEKYKDLDIKRYIIDKCINNQEIERCNSELILYKEKNLLDVLKYMVYLVDLMRDNNIIWGVGRGSSVSSYVLFKIGLHKINSIEYDLDIKDFLR